jgi:hypothetical protein
MEIEVFTKVKIRLWAYDIFCSFSRLPTFQKLDTVQRGHCMSYGGGGMEGSIKLGPSKVCDDLDH